MAQAWITALSADTGDVIRNRRQAGFVDDRPDVIARAVADFARRVAEGNRDSDVFVLTDNETETMRRWRAAAAASGALDTALKAHADELAYYELEADMSKPLVRLYGLTGASSRARQSFADALPAGVQLQFIPVTFTHSDIRRAEAFWQAEYDRWAVGEPSAVTDLNQQGIAVHNIGLPGTRGRPFLIASSTTVAPADIGQVLSARSSTRDVATVTDLRIQDVPTPASRVDNPGQVKAGYRISQGCTSNVSIKSGDMTWLLTAGHCLSGTHECNGQYATPFFHNSAYLGLGTDKYLHCGTNQGRDYARIALDRKNLASHHYVSSTTFGEFIVADIGGSAPLGPGSGFQIEGASPFRAQATVSTPATSTMTTNGFFQVDMPPGAYICPGDSGGLVRSWGTVHGILHAITDVPGDTLTPPDCGRRVFYSHIARALADYGATVVTASQRSPTSVKIRAGSGTCLDTGWNPTYWQKWIMWDCHGLPPQTLHLTPSSADPSGTLYSIQSREGNPLPACLDYYSALNWWENVHTWSCYGGTNQL